jgi:hypothetical protein
MISNLRSINQQITSSRFKSAKDLVSWLGALQAQDYNMVKWALGVRLENSTENIINNEIDAGNIIRTHLLRPTWHIVSSDDINWMLELTAPQISSILKLREKRLGLTETIIKKCRLIFEKSLRDGNHKTREELIPELLNANIRVDDNRASHIFLRAEIDGLLCSGRQKGGKPTCAILSEWVPVKKHIYRDEALKELALRYFSSRGPATIRDFSWWSGLTLTKSRLAMEFNKPNMVSDTIENITYWFIDSPNPEKAVKNDLHLLPAYDEFLISYHDRSAQLLSVYNKKAISNNGIFYPTILMEGQITGTWKPGTKDKRIILTINLFNRESAAFEKILSKSISRYSRFYDKPAEMVIHKPD